MKAIIWLVYISSIVILCIQADVQDNDHIDICSKCADTSLPRCESTEEERLDKKLDCQSKECVIGLDTETNYICLMELQSAESSVQKSKDEVTETTVLPVPIALQMVSTTERSKAASMENNKLPEFVKENNKAVEQLESIAQNIKHNAALETESDPDETDKMVEQAEDTQLVGSEHKDEQAAEVSEGEVAAVQENVAESPEIPETSDTTVAEMPQTVGGEVADTVNSPDYPADAPINEGSESQLAEEQPENATPEGVNNAEQTEQQNMSDTHQEATEGNKEPEMNGGETAVGEAASETQIQINNSDGVDVISETDDTMTAVPSTALATDSSLPVTIDLVLSCYSCTSSTDTKCAQGPGRAINCPAMENKQNGCYTLYKADTNITTRGCISELTSEGLKYCKSNAKRCFLCYEKGCNNLLAPSAASQNIGVLGFWLSIGSLVFIKIMIY